MKRRGFIAGILSFLGLAVAEAATGSDPLERVHRLCQELNLAEHLRGLYSKLTPFIDCAITVQPMVHKNWDRLGVAIILDVTHYCDPEDEKAVLHPDGKYMQSRTGYFVINQDELKWDDSKLKAEISRRFGHCQCGMKPVSMYDAENFGDWVCLPSRSSADRS